MKVEPSRFSHLLSTLLHWGPSFQNMTFWGLRDTCLNHWKCVFMATPHKKTVKKTHSTLRNWGLQKLPCCPADSGQRGAQKLVWGPCFKYWSLLDTLWIHWTWGKKSSNFYLECEHKILIRLKEQRPLWPWSNWNQKCPNEPKGEVGQDWNEGIGVKGYCWENEWHPVLSMGRRTDHLSCVAAGHFLGGQFYLSPWKHKSKQ